MKFSLSLRGKLFGLGALCVALVSVPLIFLAGRDFQENSRERERAAFANLVILLEENISTLYFSFLTTFAADVMEAKLDLSRMTHLGRQFWLASTDREIEHIFNTWQRLSRHTGFYLTVFRDGEARYGDMAGTGSIDRDNMDFTGEPLAEMLLPQNLPDAGKCAVFNLSPENWRHFDPQNPLETATKTGEGGAVPVLISFMPVPEKNGVITLAMPLKILDAKNREKEIAGEVQDKFDSMRLAQGRSLKLFDSKGRDLARKGPEAIFEAVDDRSYFYTLQERLKRENVVETLVIPKSYGKPVLYRIARFKPLDWYVAAAAPLEDVEASTTRLTRRLVLLAAITTIAALLVTLALAAALIRPLRALTVRANALAEADLSAPGAVLAALDGLEGQDAVGRNGEKDEVRHLTLAFSRLGTALDRKIGELMAATAVKERMQGELAAAREIQRGIIPAPEVLAGFGGLEMSAMLVPAREVGGDFYDFFSLPDGRLAVAMGDVSGKGVPAAMFMAMAVALLRRLLRKGESPAVAMAGLSDSLAENNPNTMFLTLFVGFFNPATGTLDYANGGHCRPMIVDAAGNTRILEETSGPLVGALPDMKYVECRAMLRPDETCLIFTDGVTEAMNPARQLYAQERLARCLSDNRAKGVSDMLAAVHASVLDFSAGEPQSDDIALLAFRVAEPLP